MVDEMIGRHDRNTPHPQIVRAGPFEQDSAVAVEQMRPDDLVRRTIHQIPVVDPRHVAAITVEHLLFDAVIAAPVALHQEQ